MGFKQVSACLRRIGELSQRIVFANIEESVGSQENIYKSTFDKGSCKERLNISTLDIFSILFIARRSTTTKFHRGQVTSTIRSYAAIRSPWDKCCLSCRQPSVIKLAFTLPIRLRAEVNCQRARR